MHFGRVLIDPFTFPTAQSSFLVASWQNLPSGHHALAEEPVGQYSPTFSQVTGVAVAVVQNLVSGVCGVCEPSRVGFAIRERFILKCKSVRTTQQGTQFPH